MPLIQGPLASTVTKVTLCVAGSRNVDGCDLPASETPGKGALKGLLYGLGDGRELDEYVICVGC